MSSTRPVTREDVVGHRLVEIVQAFTTGKAAHVALTFYRLDNGVPLFLPRHAEHEIVAEQPPPEAEPIVHPLLLDHVIGQTIVEVYHAGEYSSDNSPYLALENGYMVDDVIACPIGLRLLGLYIYPPGEIDMATLVPFWSQR
jgi:hypothetical protein